MDSKKPIQLIQECPLCGKKYRTVNIRVVRESNEGTLLYFRCSDCHGGLIASIMDAPFGLIGSGLVTDLQFEEVEKFLGEPEVTEDDVLAVYTLLEGKNRRGYVRK